MVRLDILKAEELVDLVHWMNEQGWSPATSTNYSFKNSEYPLTIAVSTSGVDKSQFGLEHLLLVDIEGEPLPQYKNLKTSAETLLHTVLYQEDEDIEVVLHSHSVYATVLSKYYEKQGSLKLKNYEVLKGLDGISTPKTTISLPIFENIQNMEILSEAFREQYKEFPTLHGYLIAGHGLYTWGNSFEAAKRHLESLEFLLECQYKFLMLKA